MILVCVFKLLLVLVSVSLTQYSRALSGELIKIKAAKLKPPPELDRNGKGGNRNAAHPKYKCNFQNRKYTPKIQMKFSK